tara:strand:- start:189 stop:629 length:441 start_codon:yes stop_codon:yes gene_type:complete
MYKKNIIQFIVMTLIGICFNPMNMLAYRFKDLYFSLTLFYGGLLMASNMIWSHEIVHYLSMGMFDKKLFLFGIILSVIIVMIMRKQILVNDKQWLRRMIPHHSTALTTSNQIMIKTKDKKIKKLANEIIETQEREIKLMKDMINNV